MQSTKDDILWPEIGVAFQHVPVFVERELLDFDNWVASFKKATSGLMAQIMEPETVYFTYPASPSEKCSHGLCVIREDEGRDFGLSLKNVPGGLCVLESAMVPTFLSRMLKIADHPGQRFGIIIAPFETRYLRLSA